MAAFEPQYVVHLPGYNLRTSDVDEAGEYAHAGHRVTASTGGV